jgi:hypothetical protein
MKASNIFSEPEELVCHNCGKNLLENVNLSMVLIVRNEKDQIIAVKPCCKKKCDNQLRDCYKGLDTNGWKELSDFLNPYTYMKHIVAVMNSMFEKELFADESAFYSYKDLILSCYQYIARDMTEAEKDDASIAEALPF